MRCHASVLKTSAADVGLHNWIVETLPCIFTAGILTVDRVPGRLFEPSSAESRCLNRGDLVTW